MADAVALDQLLSQLLSSAILPLQSTRSPSSASVQPEPSAEVSHQAWVCCGRRPPPGRGADGPTAHQTGASPHLPPLASSLLHWRQAKAGAWCAAPFCCPTYFLKLKTNLGHLLWVLLDSTLLLLALAPLRGFVPAQPAVGRRRRWARGQKSGMEKK